MAPAAAGHELPAAMAWASLLTPPPGEDCEEDEEEEVLDVPPREDTSGVRLAFLDAILEAYSEEELPEAENEEFAPVQDFGAGNAFDFLDMDLQEAGLPEAVPKYADEDLDVSRPASFGEGNVFDFTDLDFQEALDIQDVEEVDLLEAMRFPAAAKSVEVPEAEQREDVAWPSEEEAQPRMPEFGAGNAFDFDDLDSKEAEQPEEAAEPSEEAPQPRMPEFGAGNAFDFEDLDGLEATRGADGLGNAFDFQDLEEREAELQPSPREEPLPEAVEEPAADEAAGGEEQEEGKEEEEEEDLAEACRAAGLPLEDLESPEEAPALLREFRRLEACSAPELLREHEQRGFAADDEMPRRELLARVREALLAPALALLPLRRLCRERGVLGEGPGPEKERPELLRLLACGSWRAVGIPLDRLPGLESAQDLLAEVRRLRTQPAEKLAAMCRERGMPTEGLLKKELVSQMQQALMWEQMPAAELKKECRAKGISAEGLSISFRGSMFRHTSKEEASLLVQRLSKSLWFETWEAKGVPVKKLSTPEVAEEVFQEVVRLEGLSSSGLEGEFRKLNVPLLTGVSHEALLSFMKDARTWMHFSTAELRRECSRLEVRGSMANLVWEDVFRCLVEELCLRLWEANGLPVVRALGSFQSAASLVAEYEHLEGMGTVELRQQYESMGLPKAKGTEVGALRTRLKKVYTWWALPLEALRKECVKQGIPTAKAAASQKEEELKEGVVQQLLIRECFKTEELDGILIDRLHSIQAVHQVIEEFKQYKSMGISELKNACTELGVPPERGMDGRPALLERIRTVVTWRWLPLEELQKECWKRGLKADEGGRTKDELEKRNELLQRLLSQLAGSACDLSGVPVERLGAGPAAFVAQEFAKLEGMNDEQLREQHRDWGLPNPRTLSKSELLRKLKEATIWWNLPRHELIAECNKRSIPTDGLRRTADEDAYREQVIDLLLYSTNLYQYEAQGIPAKQLRTWKACANLVAEWAFIDSESTADLTKRYQDLGLPSRGLGRTEIVARMRQVALWLHLPLAVVQKECRAKHVNSIATEESKSELVIGLCHAHWMNWEEEPEPPPASGASAFGGTGFGTFGGGTSRQRGGRGAAAPIGLAMHYAALELPPSAGLEEVKKAYRKLALKYHPDKNQGSSQERAAQEFRRVADAYQALSKHLEGP